MEAAQSLSQSSVESSVKSLVQSLIQCLMMREGIEAFVLLISLLSHSFLLQGGESPYYYTSFYIALYAGVHSRSRQPRFASHVHSAFSDLRSRGEQHDHCRTSSMYRDGLGPALIHSYIHIYIL